MKISLIAFDLDGTLLRDDKSLSPRNLAALRAAAERGALIVPATGRIYRGVPEILQRQSFIRYCISVNGAKVIDVRSGETIFREELPIELTLRLMEHMDGLDVVYDCYKDDWGYVSRDMFLRAGEYISDRGILELFYRSRTPVEDLKTFLRESGGSVQKTQMHFRDLRARKAELERLPTLFDGISVTSSIATNIEINSAAADKGAALRALCAALGVAREETVAFGDGTNDISMLRFAGLGVAMGNADFLVKAAADTVTEDNEHDGVARVIERLLAE